MCNETKFCVKGGGLFLELSKKAMLTGNTAELDEAIRSKVKFSTVCIRFIH